MNRQYDWIEDRFRELTEALTQPELANDPQKRSQLLKNYSEWELLAKKAEEVRKLDEEIISAEELKNDPEFHDEAEKELLQLNEQRKNTSHELDIMLLPKDEDADKNVVMEIRQGAGGEEAALFGTLLLRMYSRYAERRGFRLEPVSYNMTELGGVKEAVFTVTGNGVYERLQYESGVHRIQRVPSTESGGRIHTSTCTVAVLPEAENVDIEINPQDLRIDTYRASGHGGQYINRTDSAVRITHFPSGLVVTCQDEKSQLKNKEKAMKVLKSRLYDKIRDEKDQAYANRRRGQVGTGDRSERVRSYNFPQGRVTDHRIGLTLYKIDSIVDGDLDEIINALLLADQEEKLKIRG